MRSAKSVALVAISAIGVAMLCVPATAMSARLVWNFTQSIPIGLYWIEDRSWRKGDRVAVEPSGSLRTALQRAEVLENGRVLLKRVVAVAGDVVCRSGAQVSVNGFEVATARPDENLPTWSGCVRLRTAQIFLLGETEDSFDGRYFGVTSGEDIVGAVQLLLPF